MRKLSFVLVALASLALASTGCTRSRNRPVSVSPTATAPVHGYDRPGNGFLRLLAQLNEPPDYVLNDVLGPSPTLPIPADVFLAADEGQAHVVGAMLVKDPSLARATDSGGRTLLHFARSAGEVDFLLRKGLDINARDLQGNTPLFYMAARNDAEVVDEAVARGAAVNATNNRGATPLHVACCSGNRSVVRILIGDGAKVDARTLNGVTPLMMAVGADAQDCAQALVDARADVKTRDGRGNTILHIAIVACPDYGPSNPNNGPWCDWLAYRGVDLNAQNDGGNTPLHICVLTEHANFAQALIGRDARLDLRNRAGLTPLELARKLDNTFMSAVLQGQSPRQGESSGVPGRGSGTTPAPGPGGSALLTPDAQGAAPSPGIQSAPAPAAR